MEELIRDIEVLARIGPLRKGIVDNVMISKSMIIE